METKKLFIIVLVVIFGICFITTLSSIQRMDSDQMMVDPENPSITAQTFSEPTDIRVSSAGSSAVSAGLVVGRWGKTCLSGGGLTGDGSDSAEPSR